MSFHRRTTSEGLSKLDNSPAKLLIMITSFAFLVREERSVVLEKSRTLKWGSVRQIDPPPHMIQLPSNFLLPLWLHFSKCSERNVPQIRVSARWGGWETGKRREGRETERKTNSSQFTQAKHLLAHLCVGFITILWILQTASRLVSGHGHTHTHKDRQRQAISLSSYKVRLQQACVPKPFENECQRGCKISSSHRAVHVATFLW